MQQELCVELNKRAPLLLESEKWADCKFVVGTKSHQVVFGAYKLIMALASPVFEAMFYGSLAETSDHIPVVDVEPRIFQAMLKYTLDPVLVKCALHALAGGGPPMSETSMFVKPPATKGLYPTVADILKKIYIYTGNINLTSCGEASELCYAANKYLLHHLADECSNYLWNNVKLGNVCQLYEYSQLFDDKVLTQKCTNMFADRTKEVLKSDSFKEAGLSMVEKIFSLNELNIDDETDLMNAAALYIKAQANKVLENLSSCPGTSTAPHEDISMENVDDNLEGALDSKDVGAVANQPTPGPSNATNVSDMVDIKQIRRAVRHIRFLMYTDCTARTSLLTPEEDQAVLENLTSDEPKVPMPKGLSESSIPRETVDKARSEATFRYTVQNFSGIQNDVMSPVFHVRKLPWQIKTMPRVALSQQIKSMGFFVQCSTESESESWSCKASIKLRLINHKPGVVPFTRMIQHVYTKKEYDWGFSHFLPWDTVVDPTQGYIQDDAITLEAHIIAEEPQGVI